MECLWGFHFLFLLELCALILHVSYRISHVAQNPHSATYFFMDIIGQGGISSGLFVSHFTKSSYYSITFPFSNSSRSYLCFVLAHAVFSIRKSLQFGSNSQLLVLVPNITGKEFLRPLNLLHSLFTVYEKLFLSLLFI